MQNGEGIDGFDYYEGQPKWPITRILKYVFSIISAIVYLILMIRIFGSCDSGFAETLLLDEESRSKIADIDNISVQRIYSETTESDDGRIQLQFITYIEDCDNFQMTLKLNSRHYGDFDSYSFCLKRNGSAECEYKDHYYDSLKRIGYDYLRLCFKGVEYDKNDTLTLVISDKNGEKLYSYDVYSDIYYSKPIKADKVSNY